MVLVNRQTVQRFSTCFQNEGTQRVYLAAWRKAKSCAHCLVLAETARFCGTSAEGFEYHDLREYRVSDMDAQRLERSRLL